MSRPGVTYQNIANAANELKDQGKNITIENVRSILGTGSISTINNHLRKWKETQNSADDLSAKQQIPPQLVSLMKGLWEGVLTEAKQQFLLAEAKLQQETTELNAELEKYKNNNQRWQKMFNVWQQEKSQLANEKLTLDQALTFAHQEIQSLHAKYDSLLQQSQEKQERITELHRLHQQTQANLEHYRESAREQRLLDQQQFEHEKQQLQSELKYFKEQLSSKNHENKILEQENQLSRQKNCELENHCQQALLENESLKNKLHQLEKSHIENQQINRHWQAQYQALEIKFENKVTEWISLQSDHKALKQQLLDINQSLSHLQDQNKLLATEKWELAQEKAQLEGQLKQMAKMLSQETQVF